MDGELANGFTGRGFHDLRSRSLWWADTRSLYGGPSYLAFVNNLYFTNDVLHPSATYQGIALARTSVLAHDATASLLSLPASGISDAPLFLVFRLCAVLPFLFSTLFTLLSASFYYLLFYKAFVFNPPASALFLVMLKEGWTIVEI